MFNKHFATLLLGLQCVWSFSSEMALWFQLLEKLIWGMEFCLKPPSYVTLIITKFQIKIDNQNPKQHYAKNPTQSPDNPRLSASTLGLIRNARHTINKPERLPRNTISRTLFLAVSNTTRSPRNGRQKTLIDRIKNHHK